MHRKVLDISFLIHRMRTLNSTSLVSETNADSAKPCHAVDSAYGTGWLHPDRPTLGRPDMTTAFYQAGTNQLPCRLRGYILGLSAHLAQDTYLSGK
jgi:hypothetical protein